MSLSTALTLNGSVRPTFFLICFFSVVFLVRVCIALLAEFLCGNRRPQSNHSGEVARHGHVSANLAQDEVPVSAEVVRTSIRGVYAARFVETCDQQNHRRSRGRAAIPQPKSEDDSRLAASARKRARAMDTTLRLII
jgi:hypothetical protein